MKTLIILSAMLIFAACEKEEATEFTGKIEPIKEPYKYHLTITYKSYPQNDLDTMVSEGQKVFIFQSRVVVNLLSKMGNIQQVWAGYPKYKANFIEVHNGYLKMTSIKPN